MVEFVCEICFDPKSTRLQLPKLQTGNGDDLRTRDCGHPFCQDCMATYVSSRVDEQFVFHLRCPYDGCTTELYEQDVRRLEKLGVLKSEVADRFAELRARDYSERAKVLTEQMMCLIETNHDYRLARRLCRTTRLCPRCSVAMEKASGCDSFHCICGHAFNFTSAPNVLGLGKGIADFSKVISFAKNQQMPLSIAELHHRSHCGDREAKAKIEEKRNTRRMRSNATKLAQQMPWLSLLEVEELQQQALAGDEAARLRIQEARKSMRQLQG